MQNTDDRHIYPDDFDAVVRVLVSGLSQAFGPDHRDIMEAMGMLPGIKFSINLMENTATKLREECERLAEEQQNGN